MEQKNSYEKIYDIVKQIPRGTVATYGQVAALAGNKRWARVVGYALHVNPDPEGIPCYRVVNREGRVSEALCIWWRKQADRTFGSGWHRGKRRMC